MSNFILPTIKTTVEQRNLLTCELLKLRSALLDQQCRTSMYVYERHDFSTGEPCTLVNVHFHNDAALARSGEIGEAVYDILVWHTDQCVR